MCQEKGSYVTTMLEMINDVVVVVQNDNHPNQDNDNDQKMLTFVNDNDDESTIIANNHHHHHIKSLIVTQKISNGSSDYNDDDHLPLSPSLTPPISLSPVTSPQPSSILSSSSSSSSIITTLDCDDRFIKIETMNNSETVAATTTTMAINLPSIHHHRKYQSSPSSSLYQQSIPTINEQCIINTQLANHQSLRQQEQSYQNKILLAQKILKIIKNDDYEQFAKILQYTKPDLNVFINGQTALHYCLLLGRDVSWCKLLVLNGANPNLSNQDGWHPLHLAAFRGLKESVNYLTNCNNSFYHHDNNLITSNNNNNDETTTTNL
ncbi:hypothetical protein DERF_013817 [Dermatophagoides farinae]|uniref:Uncharacterized protein n=2 Tax=Dermatophagoides farinae TaxID=6954 RepID=A0A922KZ46_DERFA|nr:hypothetical protein DERF_013817 [Dermatophagoides farinae]